MGKPEHISGPIKRVLADLWQKRKSFLLKQAIDLLREENRERRQQVKP